MDPPTERSQRHGVGIVDTIGADGEVAGVSVCSPVAIPPSIVVRLTRLSAQGFPEVANSRVGYSRRTFAVSS